MSIEVVQAAMQFQKVAEYHRKENEHLRAVLVHIMLDIEEWREGVEPSWSGAVLDAIEKRVKAELEKQPTPEPSAEGEKKAKEGPT